MLPGDCTDLAVERGNAGQNVAARLHQSFENRNQLGGHSQLPFDNLFCTAPESADTLAEHDAESLQQAPDLVLEPNTHPDQRLARREHRSVDIGLVALDPDGLEPAGAQYMGKAPGIMPIGLVGHHLQDTMARVDADDRGSRAVSAFQSQTASGPVSMPTRSSSSERSAS